MNFPFPVKAALRLLSGLFLAAWTVASLRAQPQNTDFGAVTRADFDELTTLADTTAEAVVLYDYGHTTFTARGTDIWLQTRQHVRLYIRKKAAYRRATVEVSLQRGEHGPQEAIQGLNGFTYNLVNGQLVREKLSKDAVFTEKANEGLQVKKFTLPNVREGSIIEYEYTKLCPFNVRMTPETWYFQSDIPVRWSEYVFEEPEYFTYKTIMNGYLPLAQNESKNVPINFGMGLTCRGVSHRYAVKDAPAFANEPFITTPKDYLSGINFELAGYRLPNMTSHSISLDWESIDRTLLSHEGFGTQIQRAGFMKEAIALAKTQPDSLQRLTTLYDYVRRNIKWNKQMALFSSGSRKVFEKREGDAADINLLLVALLRETGFTASPVILSTRTNGRINQFYGLLRQFNYVVAHVTLPGGQTLLLDATDPLLKPGMLPEHCLTQVGRLITPTGGTFISLAPKERDLIYASTQLVLDETGALKGTFRETQSGYRAWKSRHELADGSRETFLKKSLSERSGWQVSASDIKAIDAIGDDLIIDHQLDIPEACLVAGDRLYLKPMLTEGISTNPFREAERLYPIDFGKGSDRKFFAQITIPEGYEVEQLPKPALVSLTDNGGQFRYQVTQTDRMLIITSFLTVRKPIFLSEDYQGLREFYNLVLTKHAETIVLKRTAATASR